MDHKCSFITLPNLRMVPSLPLNFLPVVSYSPLTNGLLLPTHQWPPPHSPMVSSPLTHGLLPTHPWSPAPHSPMASSPFTHGLLPTHPWSPSHSPMASCSLSMSPPMPSISSSSHESSSSALDFACCPTSLGAKSNGG